MWKLGHVQPSDTFHVPKHTFDVFNTRVVGQQSDGLRGPPTTANTNRKFAKPAENLTNLCAFTYRNVRQHEIAGPWIPNSDITTLSKLLCSCPVTHPDHFHTHPNAS